MNGNGQVSLTVTGPWAAHVVAATSTYYDAPPPKFPPVILVSFPHISDSGLPHRI